MQLHVIDDHHSAGLAMMRNKFGGHAVKKR